MGIVIACVVVSLLAGAFLLRGKIAGLVSAVTPKASVLATPLQMAVGTLELHPDVEAFMAIRTLRQFAIDNKNAALLAAARECGRSLFDSPDPVPEIAS